MKFKKALAVILAVAMVITLMPSMAFAASTNSVVKTYTVAAGEDMPVVAIDLKVTNTDGITSTAIQKLKITLDNAEWAVDKVDENNLVNAAAVSVGGVVATTAGLSFYAVTKAGLSFDAYDNSSTNNGTITVNSVDSDSASVTLKGVGIEKDGVLRVYLALKAGSDDGEVKVTIDAGDSDFTGNTYTVATVSGSTTVAEVTGSVKTYARTTLTGAAVTISETSVNSISDHQILKLTLPSGYSWNAVEVSGDLASGTQTFASTQTNLSDVVSGTEGTDAYFDGRTAYIYVSVSTDAGIKQDLVIKPNFTIGKDASMGDVTLAISGYKADSGNKIANETGLVVAKYGDESVTVSTVSEENLPTVVAGFEQDADGDNFVVQVTFKEAVQGSLTAGRFIDFDFNDEVQIVTNAAVKYYVGTNKSASYTKLSSQFDSDAKTAVATSAALGLIDRESDVTKDCSEMTIKVPSSNGDITGWKTTKANTLTVFIPVTVKANYTGDITLNIKGAKAGVDETTLVVGKVIAPFSVETTVTDVINGAQSQAAANVVIKENIVGYLDANDTITLTPDTLGLSDGFSFGTNAKATVTSGDLELKSGNILTSSSPTAIKLTVKNPSTTVSTIEVSGVVVNMARNLPEGEYKLTAKLSGVENGAYDNANFGKTVAKPAYVNIKTAAENNTVDTSINSQFVIGQSSYTNNGEAAEMDAAPYIDSNNRTMVPIRYIANACGVSDDNITWNQATQTATLNGANTVVTIKVGSNTIQTSTGTITMDTVAVNNNGRIYVPARFIANALGANVTWDAATKTVGISK
jgi:hypothetical protein